jgi:WD40 repeat protein
MMWSPDSRYIAFRATDENYDTNLQVVDVSTGQLVADFDYDPRVIAWSPDCTRLAVNAERDTGDHFGGLNEVRPITILNIHTGSATVIGSDVDINGIAWSPDGTRLAVTTSRYEAFEAYSSTVQVWDAATGAVVADLVGDAGFWVINSYWYAPVWSPDGSRLAVPNVDGSFAVWDVARQEKVFDAWGFPEYTGNLAWNPTGDRIAASGSNMLRTWDALTGEPLSAIPTYVSDVRWVSDRQLAVVRQDKVTIIDPLTGRASGTLETGLDPAVCTDRWAPCIVWSPDGQYAAYADDHEIHILSLAYSPAQALSPPVTLTLVDSVPPPLSALPTATEPITPANADQLVPLGQLGRDDIGDVQWSPDGSPIALLGTHGVWLYDDPNLSRPPHLLKVTNGAIRLMRFSPDGRYLVLALEDEVSRDFGIRLWDLRLQKVARVLEGHTGPVTAMDFSADGHWLATGSADLTVRLWDVDTGQQNHVLWSHVDSVMSVDFSPDASLLVSAGDSRMRLWDVQSGELLDTYNGDTEYERDPRVVNALFTPDGSTVLFYYLDLTWENVYLRWRSVADAGAYRSNRGPGISPFGSSGFVGTGPRYDIAFSPDGSHMIPYTLYGSFLRMLDVNTGEEAKEWWLLSCVSSSGAVAFSPDGSTLATGVSRNMACGLSLLPETDTVLLWGMQPGEPYAVLRGHVAPVDRLVFSPDSRRLLSVSTDNTVRLWDVATGENLRLLTDYRKPAAPMDFDSTGTLISLEIARDAVVMRRNGQPVRGVGGTLALDFVSPPITSIQSNAGLSFLISGASGFSRIYSSDVVGFTIWNIDTGERFPRLSYYKMYPGQSAAINPSGTLFATSQEGVVKLWDIGTQTEQEVLVDSPNLNVGSLNFSRDGRLLAGAVGHRGLPLTAVKFWELATGAQRSITLPDLEGSIAALTFSPDSRYLAVQTTESEVRVLSLQTNTAPVKLHLGVKTIQRIAFSQDSSLLALVTDQGVQVWDRATGRQIVSLPGSSVSAAFNRDDTLLASGETDGTVQLWGVR